ncbi:MAG: MAPEG family protein [Rhodobacteraceae bacterium]|nr:MAPEG family protein [Paracoccaceae bacterium]
MTPELTVLALAGLLQSVQFATMAIPANRELGLARTMAPRDDGPLSEHVSTRTARLARAMNNHFEALILFTLAVVVVTLGDASSGFTAACAWVYLVARILYVPAYAFGLVPWRSIVFGIGFTATMLMILAALV